MVSELGQTPLPSTHNSKARTVCLAVRGPTICVSDCSVIGTLLYALFQRVLHSAKALAILAGACMGVHDIQEQPDACSIKVAGYVASCGEKQQIAWCQHTPPSLTWRSPWSSDAPRAPCHPAPRRAAALPKFKRGAQQVSYMYRRYVKLHPGDGAEARTR